jgi:hypothetical protein
MKKIWKIIFWSILGVAGIAIYLIALFVPTILFFSFLRFFVEIGPDLALVFSFMFCAVWSMILPAMFD